MKKILLYILPSFIVLSCNKMLDEDAKSQATTEYLNTAAGFEDATNAAYSSLRNFYATERGMTLTVFGTDTYTMGSDGGFKFVNQYTAALNASVSIIREIWDEFYIAINTCNTVIDMAPNIPAITETTRKTRVAEAKFLRAHYFFVLAQMFGPIHLPLQMNTVVVTEATREPMDKVYATIIADLDAAIVDLPIVKLGDYNGRVTKGAAEHLLARVYLTKASSAARAADDYSKALTFAKNVINNYDYRLLTDFTQIFEQGSSEQNEEVIWSVQYTNSSQTNSTGNKAHLYFLMEYDVLPGMLRDVENGRPFKRFRPTVFTLDSIFKDRVNDTRYEKSFKHVFFSNNAISIPLDANGIPKYRVGDTCIWLPGRELSASEISSKPFAVYPPSLYTARIYPTLIKFLDPLRPDKTTEEGSRDYLAFRLAETYLIAAEAAMFLGDNTAAAGFINTVRWRAARTSADPVENAAFLAAMTVTPAMINIDFILDERGRELLGEQDRWFDLVRTGKLIERVRKWNPDGAAAIQDFHVLRPIPQTQIDRTTSPFAQNAGY